MNGVLASELQEGDLKGLEKEFKDWPTMLRG